MKADESSNSLKKFLDSSTISSKSFKILTNEKKPININIPPIMELEVPNIHYRCPKCFNFPIIEFFNENFIEYCCGCNNSEKKILKIKNLLEEKEKYMTLLDENKDKSNNNEKKNNLGFKCYAHPSEKLHKFRYYCSTCKLNLCKECCTYHLDKKHDLIVLNFLNFDMYEIIDKILVKIDEEKKENIDLENLDNNSIIDNDENNDDKGHFEVEHSDTIILEELDENNLKKISSNDKKEIHRNFF